MLKATTTTSGFLFKNDEPWDSGDWRFLMSIYLTIHSAAENTGVYTDSFLS